MNDGPRAARRQSGAFEIASSQPLCHHRNHLAVLDSFSMLSTQLALTPKVAMHVLVLHRLWQQPPSSDALAKHGSLVCIHQRNGLDSTYHSLSTL
jgi:hypothetical protein